MRYRVASLVMLVGLLALGGLGLRSAPAHADAAESWRVVGQIGGPTQAVAVQGQYAYVGVGLRLVVLDVTDPTTPVELGSTAPFPYFVEDIVVSGTLACVAAGGAGLRVVDVTDPANPVEVGFWDSPGYAEGVAISGTVAYLADGPYGLRAVDISDPIHPVPLGAAFDTNYAFEVAVSGHYAYVAAAGAGLLVADVSDPAHAVEIATFDTPGYAYGVAVSGTVVYVADGWEGLRLVDISDPARPGEVSSVDTPGWALSLASSGPTVYVADGAFGLRVIDVSDPASPREVGAYQDGGLARRVAIAGSTAYVADQRGGLRLVDVSTPAQPVQRGISAAFAEARRLAVDGSLAYVAAGSGGLRVIDWSNPAAPREVGAYDTAGGYSSSVVVTGTTACVATYLSGGGRIHLVDVAVPTQPLRLSTVQVAPTDYRHLAVRGTVLYVVDEAGLRLLDISDPSQPVNLGQVRTDQENESSVEVALSGRLAFLAVARSGMVVIDVSDPSHPLRVGAYQTGRFVHGVAAAGERAYVLYGEDGIDVVQVVPELPGGVSLTRLGYWDTPGAATSLSLDGSLAYVADDGGGVQVVDVSDASQPAVLARVDTPGQAWQAVVAGDYVLVADGEGGLLILQRQASGLPVRGAPTAAGRRVAGNVAAPASAPLVPGAVGPGARLRSVSGVEGQGRESVAAVTRVVTSALDNGAGTLREALSSAGAGDTILFDPAVFPPTPPVTITLSSPLPALSQGRLTVDASNAGVVIDGGLLSGPNHGLLLLSDANVVRGLMVVGFSLNAIELIDSRDNVIGGDRGVGAGPLGQGNLLSGNSGGLGMHGSGTTNNLVQGNLIGTDVTGRTARANMIGIQIQDGAHHNRIGGAAAGQTNVISGNWSRGIQLIGEDVSGNVVAGNLIGTDVSGTLPVPNYLGIIAESGASSNVIGGTTRAEANVISGNSLYGAVLSDPGTTHNVVIGNLIGTDASGTRAVPNHGGVSICGTSGYNRVGGTAPGEGNLISGNEGGGISLTGDELEGNLFLGNQIGTDISGQRPLGNGAGISLDANTRHNIIGGSSPEEANVVSGDGWGIVLRNTGVEDTFILGNRIGTDRSGTAPIGHSDFGVRIQDYSRRTFVQGNTIAFSQQAGVAIVSGQQNTVRRNAIYGSGGRGIELSDGGNEMLAAPVIAAASATTVSGTACPAAPPGADGGCTVEVYSDQEDEGRWYEGTAVADAEGRFELSKTGGWSGRFLTATATDAEGNTSEFSAPVLVVRGRVWLPAVGK